MPPKECAGDCRRAQVGPSIAGAAIRGQFILRKVIPALQHINWHRFLQRAPLPHAKAEDVAALRRTPILITGAGGSIGAGIALRLADESVELTLLGRNRAGTSQWGGGRS